MNAFNCRFQLWIADAFTRYTVQAAIICGCGYNKNDNGVIGTPNQSSISYSRISPVAASILYSYS